MVTKSSYCRVDGQPTPASARCPCSLTPCNSGQLEIQEPGGGPELIPLPGHPELKPLVAQENSSLKTDSVAHNDRRSGHGRPRTPNPCPKLVRSDHPMRTISPPYRPPERHRSPNLLPERPRRPPARERHIGARPILAPAPLRHGLEPEPEPVCMAEGWPQPSDPVRINPSG